MKELQTAIGGRLKEIRTNYYAKHKLSVSDFAEELNETRHNIGNYERGIANIPNRLLVSLYEKGFNPIYILTGEGSIFAPNEPGAALAKASNIHSIASSIEKFDSAEQLKSAINAAAGDIARLIEQTKTRTDK